MNRYSLDNRRDTGAVATIANGQTTSSTIECGNATLAALVMPAAFTGASITFNGSVDGANFFPLQDSAGVAAGSTVAAGVIVGLDMAAICAVPYLQIVASAQAAARTIGLVFWN